MRFVIAMALLAAAACGGDDDDGATDARPTADARTVDASPTPDADCFENPTTHDEIINACTTAQKIYKDSDPPLLNPDGTLPPLPP
jgi:hypothetical protein